MTVVVDDDWEDIMGLTSVEAAVLSSIRQTLDSPVMDGRTLPPGLITRMATAATRVCLGALQERVTMLLASLNLLKQRLPGVASEGVTPSQAAVQAYTNAMRSISQTLLGTEPEPILAQRQHVDMRQQDDLMLLERLCDSSNEDEIAAIFTELYRRLARNARCPRCKAELPTYKGMCAGCAKV